MHPAKPTGLVRAKPTLWEASDALEGLIGPKIKPHAELSAAAGPRPIADAGAIRLALMLPGNKRKDEELAVLSAWVDSLELRDERLRLARCTQPGWTSSFCRAMKLVRARPGEELFRQGDMGDHLFVILSGSVGIFRASRSQVAAEAQPNVQPNSGAQRRGSRMSRARAPSVVRIAQPPCAPSARSEPPRRRSTRVGSLAPRSEGCDDMRADLAELGRVYGRLLVTGARDMLFGELALLYEQPRAASAVVLERSELVAIQRIDFDRITRRDQKASASRGASFLHGIAEFSRFAHAELIQLQYDTREISAPAGHALMSAGFSSSVLIVVRAGMVSVRMPWRDAQSPTDVGTFGAGTVLGEIDPAAALAEYTVTTVTPADLLAIDRAALVRFVAPAAIAHMRALGARRIEAWRRRQACAATHLARSRENAKLLSRTEGARALCTAPADAASARACSPPSCVAPETRASLDGYGLAYDAARGIYLTTREAVQLGLPPTLHAQPQSNAERARPSAEGAPSKVRPLVVRVPAEAQQLPAMAWPRSPVSVLSSPSLTSTAGASSSRSDAPTMYELTVDDVDKSRCPAPPRLMPTAFGCGRSPAASDASPALPWSELGRRQMAPCRR